MRILLVSQYYFPENFRINECVENLVRLGHNVEVLTGLPNYPKGHFYKGYSFRTLGKQSHAGATVWRVPVIPRGQGRAWQLLLNYLSFVISATLGACLWFRKSDFDVIMTFQTSPITAALPALFVRYWKRKPLSIWVQDLWPESVSATRMLKSRYALRMLAWLSRYIYIRCDSVWVQSQAFSSVLQNRGVEAHRIHYLPNWAQMHYKPCEALPPLAWPKGFVCLFAGNLGRAQSLETILQAAEYTREQKHLHWVFVGDGTCRKDLQHAIATRQLSNVHYLGAFQSGDMPALLASADVVLLTLNREPIFALTVPSKLQAYLACGKPILAAIDGEAMRLIHESQAGIAVAAEAASSLAEQAIYLSELPKEVLKQMGQKGFDYYQKHFEQHQLMGHVIAYLDALKEQKIACAY